MRKNFSLRGILVNILFSILIFSIFIVTLEVLFRTTHMFGAKISYSEPDPIFSYRYTPKKKYWYHQENDHPITGRINNYGYRDKDWFIGKPSNIYRVAVLGDSMVEALQVEVDKTFVALTEHQFNKTLPLNFKIELMNFGRSGFTQTEELLLLKKDVIQFSPDIVVLFFSPWNDIQDINKETTTVPERPFYYISGSGELILDTDFAKTRSFKIRVFVNWFKQRSALISLMTERYIAYKQMQRSNAVHISETKKAEVSSSKINGFLSLCTAHPSPVYLENYQLNKILIKTMAKYCKEKGIKFMLVTLPTSKYNLEKEKEYMAIDPTYNINFFEDDMREYAKSINIEYLGLGRIFRAYEEKGIPLFWNHLNYEGHRVVADVLYNKLRSVIHIGSAAKR